MRGVFFLSFSGSCRATEFCSAAEFHGAPGCVAAKAMLQAPKAAKRLKILDTPEVVPRATQRGSARHLPSLVGRWRLKAPVKPLS